MANDIITDAVDLTKRINEKYKDNKLLPEINTRMVAVVKYLNDIRMAEITGEVNNGLIETE